MNIETNNVAENAKIINNIKDKLMKADLSGLNLG